MSMPRNEADFSVSAACSKFLGVPAGMKVGEAGTGARGTASESIGITAVMNILQLVAMGVAPRCRVEAGGQAGIALPVRYNYRLQLHAPAARPWNGQYYFATHITVDPEELARLDQVALTPGMQVEVFLNTGARTMAAYLLQPLTDSFRRAFRED